MSETLETIVITRNEYEQLMKAAQQTMQDIAQFQRYSNYYKYGEEAYRQAKFTAQLLGTLVNKKG